MQPLDLYAHIEEYLPFEDEVNYLYDIFKDIVLELNPSNLIDIGCGQGEFCRVLSSNGIETLGVDLSQKQIELAQKKGINAQCIDIKDIDKKFWCATAIFDVINYLPYDYIEKFFAYTYNLLEDNGYFIFDVNTLFGFEEVAQGTLAIDKKDKFISIDAYFKENILYTNITFFNNKKDCYKRYDGTIKQYFYSKTDIEQLLCRSGFDVEHIQSISLHNFEECDKDIFIARKKAEK